MFKSTEVCVTKDVYVGNKIVSDLCGIKKFIPPFQGGTAPKFAACCDTPLCRSSFPNDDCSHPHNQDGAVHSSLSTKYRLLSLQNSITPLVTNDDDVVG